MTASPGLRVERVSKRFEDVQALQNISITFRPGQIHAVLGENGAGKSTLVGILAGFVRPDEGSVSLNGVPLPLGQPFECRRRGIAMVHQHFTLVPAFSVAENLALAQLPTLARPLDVAQLAAPSLEKGRALGWELDPQQPVSQLSVGEQQRVEILKALGVASEVVIFDEPTAVLSPDEVLELFRVIRQLRDSGKIVVVIAHKLSEVYALADQVTVLRRGHWIATDALANVSEAQLATWMVGDVPPAPTRVAEISTSPGVSAEAVVVAGDRGETAVNGVSFEVRRGEVVGFAGVDGNGQVELAEALAGLRVPMAGELRFEGRPIDARTVRIGYVPQDRQHDGLALNMSVQENLLVRAERRPDLVTSGWLRLRAIANWAKELIRRFAIKVESPRDRVGGLSGGNQQKVVVARALDQMPELLVLVNPTRGLDIRATQYVQEQVLAARDAGTAVALFSTDLDEIQLLSDRVFVLSRGRISAGLTANSLVGSASLS